MRAVVQHHGSRAGLLPRLIEKLDGLEVEVVEDTGPDLNPWRGYQRCLAALGDDPGVILQDDSLPVSEFNRKLTEAVLNHPETVLCLFLATLPGRTARAAIRHRMDHGDGAVPIHPQDWVPVVGVYWPPEIARCALEWAATSHRHTKSDDHMLHRWHSECRYPISALVPSLVEHPDDTPSLVGNGRAAGGRNPARVAMYLA